MIVRIKDACISGVEHTSSIRLASILASFFLVTAFVLALPHGAGAEVISDTVMGNDPVL